MTLNALARTIVAVTCCATAFAEPPATQPTTRPFRDPTVADPALAQMLGGNGIAIPGQRHVPKVTQLGMVSVAGKPPEALIEVAGSGNFFVHEGSTLTVTNDGLNTVLHVDRLSSDSLEISVESQNTKIIVR